MSGNKDMKSEFTYKLQQAIGNSLPFVLFRKPAEEQIRLLVNDHSEKNKFLLHSFDNQIEKFISDEKPLSIPVDEFDFDFHLNLNLTEEFEPVRREEYEKLIQQIIHKIQNSAIEKIVISRIKQIVNQEFNLLKSFKKLTEAHANALVYLWHNPGQETWMGATPELLLSRNGTKVKTVSLAGTKLPENDWTEKEFDEQQIVTDYIASHFSGLNNLKISEAQTVRAGKFQHLKSYISAEIPENFDLKSLLGKLHPTPAVCGLPKQEAFDFIVRNEGYERGFYSGYLGIESAGSKEYFVNLRCGQFFQDKVWLYVGGGITAGSNPEKEWQETELKSGTVGNAL